MYLLTLRNSIQNMFSFFQLAVSFMYSFGGFIIQVRWSRLPTLGTHSLKAVSMHFQSQRSMKLFLLSAYDTKPVRRCCTMHLEGNFTRIFHFYYLPFCIKTGDFFRVIFKLVIACQNSVHNKNQRNNVSALFHRKEAKESG
mmetsp:Transcript_12223/g.14042  ORF Transcript_12223/g.14042 Transcript_12223/m.14042 type:complete len:141 (+) Transcript_12223:822-1244(+)